MKKKKELNVLAVGLVLLIAFAIWTLLIQIVDVRPVGVNKTDIGFSTLNVWFHNLCGVHMSVYTLTDWLGIVPILICMFFGVIGFIQLIKRKSLFLVDYDIIALGVYYIVVILGYALFEVIPINYRPILIEGIMEASYPSSTTLLVLGVMPTVIIQAKRRIKNDILKKCVIGLSSLFCVFMVIGRMTCGVHWFTDIVGSVLLSGGLYCIYRAFVMSKCGERK